MLTPRNSTGGSVSTEPPEWDSSVDGFYPLVWRWVTTLAWIQTSAGNSSGERSNTWRKDDAWERLTEIEFWKGRVLLWLTCNWGWCYFLSLSLILLNDWIHFFSVLWFLGITCIYVLLASSFSYLLQIDLSVYRISEKKGSIFFISQYVLLYFGFFLKELVEKTISTKAFILDEVLV